MRKNQFCKFYEFLALLVFHDSCLVQEFKIVEHCLFRYFTGVDIGTLLSFSSNLSAAQLCDIKKKLSLVKDKKKN